MKIRVGDLRCLVQEEMFRGVPEFAVREATRKFMDELRQHLRRHVQVSRGSEIDARDVLEHSEESLELLEEEVNTLVDEGLWRLLQRL